MKQPLNFNFTREKSNFGNHVEFSKENSSLLSKLEAGKDKKKVFNFENKIIHDNKNVSKKINKKDKVKRELSKPKISRHTRKKLVNGRPVSNGNGSTDEQPSVSSTANAGAGRGGGGLSTSSEVDEISISRVHQSIHERLSSPTKIPSLVDYRQPLLAKTNTHALCDLDCRTSWSLCDLQCKALTMILSFLFLGYISLPFTEGK